jgi:hypothetical protein
VLGAPCRKLERRSGTKVARPAGVSLAGVALSIAIISQPVIAPDERVVVASGAPQKREPTAKQAPLTRTMASMLWNLTVALDLDATVAARIFPIVSQFHQASQLLERERESIARDIRKQVASSKPDDETLKVLADSLLANHQLRSGLVEEQFSALQKFLTPIQQAKYLLLMPRLMSLHSKKSVHGIRAEP